MRSAALDRSLLSVASLRLVRVHPLRAALIWLSFHVFLAMGLGSVSTFGWKGTLFMAAAAAAIVFVDSRRRRESAMLGNLGIPAYMAPLAAVVCVLGLEFFLALAVG